MNVQEDQRLWADVSPDLLNSIYNRLSSHVDEFSSSDVFQVREGNRLVLQRRRESQIPYCLANVDIRILGMAGAWLLVKVRDAGLGWYNPLLRSPANYISLPSPSWRFSTYDYHYGPGTVLKFAFSALPTAQDSTILVVYGDRYLCMFRRGNNGRFEQKTYDFSLGGKKGQTCLGVGYKDGRFFCLFEMGDMLIFSIDENEARMLLAATKPLLPEQIQQWDYLHVVAVVVVAKKATTANDRYHEVEETIGFRLVTHWERDREGSFMLVTLEEENNDGNDMEANNETTGVILVKDRLSLKRNFDIYYMKILYALFSMLLTSFIVGTVLFFRT
ncbi:unnamed protein product [Linum tenue]|uniref:KIB1-4 beta-propeller domain-containing protein n=1 Tax=Linum tenue TaxID=586396 RepID=A0AAV0NEC1_9ROSI|nr:unnamed protein product [Linum tenue]